MARLNSHSVLFFLLNFTTSLLASPTCSSKGWQTLAPIPVEARQEHATVLLSETKLAILGGIVPLDVEPFHRTVDIVQVYDIPTDTWETVSAMPMALNHPNAAVVDGKIYLLGGLSDEGNRVWEREGGCWRYDYEENVWEELGRMPAGQERGSATMGVYGSKIVLAGGMEVLVVGPGGDQNTTELVTVYDTETGEWARLDDLPEGRDHAGGAVVDGKMYVLGGRRRGQREIRDTVFSLDLETALTGEGDEEWVTSSSRLPTPRGGLAAATVTIPQKNGKSKTLVYTLGGEGNPEDDEGLFDEVEVFDPETEEWTEKGKMLVKKHGTAAVGVGRGIYIPGGGDSEGGSPVDSFEVLYV